MGQVKVKPLPVAAQDVIPFTIIQCWPFCITVKTLVQGNITTNVGIEVENQETGKLVHEWELV